jgi:hypothetical protein
MIRLVVRACVAVMLLLLVAEQSNAQQTVYATRSYFHPETQAWLDTSLRSTITLDDNGQIMRRVDQISTEWFDAFDYRVQDGFIKFQSDPAITRRDLGPVDIIDEIFGYDSIIAQYDSLFRWTGSTNVLSESVIRTVKNGRLDSVIGFHGELPNELYAYGFNDRGLITLNGHYWWGGEFSIPQERRTYDYVYDGDGNVTTYEVTYSLYDQDQKYSGPFYTYENAQVVTEDNPQGGRWRYDGWNDYGNVVPYASYGPLNTGNTWKARIEEVYRTDGSIGDTAKYLQFFDDAGRLIRKEYWFEMGEWRLEHIDSFSYYPSGHLRSHHFIVFHSSGRSDTNSHIREIEYDAKDRITSVVVREGEGTHPGYAARYTIVYPESHVHTSSLDPDEQLAYPNPTTGMIHLTSAATGPVSIIDLTGTTQIRQSGTQTLDISHLPDGVYCLIVDGRAERIMKMRE